MAFYTEGQRDGILSPSGILCPPKFERISEFRDGLARVRIDGKYGYINSVCDLVIPCHFAEAWRFSCGLAAVMDSVTSLWGYINVTGAYQIKPQFRSVKGFSEGLGAVRTESSWGFINQHGDFVIEPKFALVNEFHEGLSAVTENIKTLKYGFIDQTGTYRLRPAFYGPDMRFSEGLATVCGKGGFGFIDKSGTLKIPYQFYNADHFVSNRSCICLKRKAAMNYGFINQNGEMVVEPKFRLATSFRDGLAMVETDEGWGYIDMAGEFVWKTREPR